MGRHNARDEERIRSSLRDAAEAYQPDRQAISTRVAQGRAADRDPRTLRRTMLGMRPAGAALAVVGVLVASGVAVRAGADDDANNADPGPAAVVPAPVATGSSERPGPAGTVGTREPPAGTTGATPPAGTTGTTGSTGAPGTPGSQPPASSPPADGATWLDVGSGTGQNSVATWSQKDVKLRNTSPLTKLDVTITVPMAPGVADAGKFTDVPNADFVVTVTPSEAHITYSFVLRDGKTLSPGNYVFAAQFTHKSGRVAGKDAYVLHAATKSASADRSGTIA